MAKATVAKAPSRIPQDVQQDIVALAVLRNEILLAGAAYKKLSAKISATLADSVVAVRS